MKTTCPRAARSAGSNANVSATGPITFTSKQDRHSSWCRLVEPPGMGDTGVVDQHIELGERLGGGLDSVVVGEIQRPGGGAEAGGDGVEPVGWPTRQQQSVRRCQRRGDRGADAAAGAGDQRCL